MARLTMNKRRRNSGIGAWMTAVIGGALAAFLASYLLFLFPPTRLFGGDELQAPKEETAAMEARPLAPQLAEFRVFIQYYPSTARAAGSVKQMLEPTGAQIEHFRELREGQLDPRPSEIIFYSDESRLASENIKAFLAVDVDHQFELARSPYYGDSASRKKIFINVF